MAVLPVVIIMLGIGLGVVGLLAVPAAEAARLAPAGGELGGTSQTAGKAVGDPVRLAVDIGAVQAPGRVATARLTAFKAPVDWQSTKHIVTRDSDPGGNLQWDPQSGRIRICDTEADSHAVDAKVFAGSSGVVYVYRGGKGHCREGAIPNYDKSKTYKFKVCLITNHGESYCNTSTNVIIAKSKSSLLFPADAYCEKVSGKASDCGPADGDACYSEPKSAKDMCEKDFEKTAAPNPCVGLTEAAAAVCREDTAGKLNTGKVGKDGVFDIGRPNGAKPPKGDAASIDDRPILSRDNASGAGGPSEPINILLGWLKWTVLGACEVGVVIVGARAAIRHKRSEAGAHATGLAWVMIACVVAGSGLAFAFVSFVVNPL
ncbi:hypothetical protein amrb99_33280 [Actinomadura sp. RB99]|uniref:hypothetical protein n=1 Tax=Actinomadura sp. RB99 TaxID=2691577 RepID=UPI00168362DA|nr:hypothetical protein [Actinomadura sp. RB99]MBD2894403.1 hypothetical protein [Actinomadura sp. RB99]